MGDRPLSRPVLIAAAFVLLLAGAAIGLALSPAPKAEKADPETIAHAALLSVRDQGRIVTSAASFVAMASASESHLGLTARKTLILPGSVRYGVDLTRLRRSNLAWDDATRTLTVTLPPLELSGPRIDPDQVREEKEGSLVMALADSEKELDAEVRREAQDDLMRQARAPEAMHLAREAAMRDVARSFAMPLRAAGVEASVAVRFVDPSGREEAAFLDRPRSVEQRLRDRQADR